MNEQVLNISIDDIIPNRFQPREVFRDQALDELALSIKEHGVIQPIIVRPIVNNKYEIIAGERRYKASTIAGKTTIPAIVRNLDDKETSKQALLENIQRQDLTPIEEARTYQTILSLDNITQEELAKTMGKSQSAISNKLRLLTLPEEVQEALLNSEISERHARSLLTVQNIEKQKALLQEVIKNKIPVRILDEMIKKENEDNEDNEGNEGNNMNNNENINSINLVTQPVSTTVNPGFLYDGNVNQSVPIKNNSESNLSSIINESMDMNTTLNKEEINNSQVSPTSLPSINSSTPVVNNVAIETNVAEQNLVQLPTSPVQNVETKEEQSNENTNLVGSIPMPVNTNQQSLEQTTSEVLPSNEVQDNRLNINTEAINKEIDKIMNNQVVTEETEQEKVTVNNSFDLDRFKKVDFNSEIKQTISGEEVIGEGLLAGKPVEEEKQPLPEETVIGKIDTIKVPAYTLNEKVNEAFSTPSSELVMNEEIKTEVSEPTPTVESTSNINMPVNNLPNGQVLISQTGGMVLPTNQEIGEVSAVSTEPNENIKNLINSQDLKLALIGIGNVINNLKARGIEVKEVRKTYADHLELTLEIKKN